MVHPRENPSTAQISTAPPGLASGATTYLRLPFAFSPLPFAFPSPPRIQRMSAATLEDFARVNDAAGATTKKLQKYAILGEYFRSLDDDDLRLAVRYCAGRAFGGTDER